MAFDLNTTKKKKELDINLCLFCQENNSDSFVNNPKESSVNNIREASLRRHDDLLALFDLECNKKTYKWHRNCYSSYVSKVNVERCEVRLQTEEINEVNYMNNEPSTSISVITRSIVQKTDFNKCIICQNISKKGIKKTYRLSEAEPAKKLLSICKQKQDNVFVRLSTCTDEKDIFAADTLYHKLCLLEYFSKKGNSNIKLEKNHTSPLNEAFGNLILEIDSELNEKCFEITYLTERLHQLYSGCEITIDNRVTKRLLVQHYGENLLFSHSSDKSKSSLVFKTNLKPNDLVEKIRQISGNSLNTKKLREEAKANNFGLNESICCNITIDSAFNNFKFPPEWETFFTDVVGKGKIISEDLRRKCISIYMDLNYVINDSALTPKHIALAQCIHHYTRSKFLITMLNKLGHSVSYSTLMKLDNQLLTYIVNSSQDQVPVPSNIVGDSSLFIHGAIDNDDFKEDTVDGKQTTHVTAMVLYQPTVNSNQHPNLMPTETISLPESDCAKYDLGLIKCQSVRRCPPICRKPDYFPKTTLVESVSTSSTSCDNIIWIMSRLDLNSKKDDLILPNNALCPGWTPFNQAISTSDMPVSSVGFCILFPAPPTTFDTVYSVLCNYLKINEQLGQTYAVLSCDMAVYLIAKLIQLQTPGFERLFLRIGSFHLAKNWLSILGQFLTDSGFSDILIETRMYGENTIKSILRGAHYNRGIRVHKIMYEACRRLQLKQFFTDAIDLDCFEPAKQLFKKLQASVMKMEEDASAIIELIKEEHSIIFQKFLSFLDEKAEQNETFKYWNEYCKMVDILLDCVKADRDGNWDLHLSVVKKMLPYFLIFNHYHYARGCVLYLDDMSNLPQSILIQFKLGKFSVKRKSGKFNGVAADHALEQSLIRSSKIQGGLIGLTSKESAMHKWCLLYHYKADMSCIILNFCDMSQDPIGETSKTHKEWSIQRIDKDEKDVQTVIQFFDEHDNPFLESNTPLRNIVSGLVATEEAASFLLNLGVIGEKMYKKFTNERIINKIKGLYAPIERNKVLSLNSTFNKEYKKKPLTKETNISLTIMLAAQRNLNMQEVLKHELLSYPPSLALENGYLKKSVKSELLNIVEKDCECTKTLDSLQILQNQAHIFDGMALIHNIPNSVISKMGSFEDLAQHQMSHIEKALSQRNTNRVDVVYDRYCSSSIKNVEHEIRADGKPPLVINIHNNLTKVPKQWCRYLACIENKKNLVQYISNFILKNIIVPPGKKLFLSGCFTDENVCFCKEGEKQITTQHALYSNHEEADTRVFLHAKHSLERDSNVHHIIIHSPDTDVFVLGIYFWSDLKELGCQGLWTIVGIGEKKRGLGCHIAGENLGETFSKTLTKLHALTGCDTTSKISTKKSAYKYARKNEEMVNVLKTMSCDMLNEETFLKLEKLYLNLMKKKGSTCDESRFLQFSTTPSAVNDICKMTSTSDSFRLHILRCLVQLYFWENSLKAIIEPLDLTKYGYYKDLNSKLRPLLMSLPATPNSLIQPCNCKNCSKKTCGCFSHGSSCCSYCKCSDLCKNPLSSPGYETDEDI